jgi:aspartyl protease family protein
MGHISIDARFKGSRWVKVRALIDTGATYCLLPPGIARRAGLDPQRRTYRVRLANGNTVRVGGDIGTVRIDGREAPATVLIGKADEPIIGVEVLEALGVGLDMKKGKLRHTRGYAVRLGGYR